MVTSSSAHNVTSGIDTLPEEKISNITRGWSEEQATKLQEAVDNIFGANSESLLGLEFSFSIADPFLTDCPLIGVSTGFTKLCGYDLHDLVGHNCRFLIDPVPGDKIDHAGRRRTKEFCQAVQRGEAWTPDSDYEYAPEGVPCDELIALQTNARKDGSLFNNLLVLKVFDLSVELGEEQSYIVGLQSELKGGKDDLAAVAGNIKAVLSSMERVKKVCSEIFYVQCSMERQFTPQQQAIVSM